MKKIAVIMFVVSAALAACHKSKPAAKPTPAGDMGSGSAAGSGGGDMGGGSGSAAAPAGG